MSFNLENPRVFNPNYFTNVTNLSYKDTPLSTIYLIAETLIFTLSISTNLLLIFLILKKTPKAFKEYSQLLFIGSFLNLFHALICFLTQLVSFLFI